jgi:hypothetical protein
MSRRNPRVNAPLVRGMSLVQSQPAAPSKILKSLTYLAPRHDGLGAAKRLQTRNMAGETGENRGKKDLFRSPFEDGRP